MREDAAIWDAFLMWWNPRNEDHQNPSMDNPRAKPCFEFYCAGRLDSNSANVTTEARER